MFSCVTPACIIHIISCTASQTLLISVNDETLSFSRPGCVRMEQPLPSLTVCPLRTQPATLPCHAGDFMTNLSTDGAEKKDLAGSSLLAQCCQGPQPMLPCLEQQMAISRDIFIDENTETWPAQCNCEQTLLEQMDCSQQAAIKCNVFLQKTLQLQVMMV